MANRRKTIEELKASGSYRPSRHKARERAEAVRSAGIIAPSHTLAPDVEAERNRLVALLGKQLTDRDGDMLTELAERVVEVRLLREAAKKVMPGTLERTRISSSLTAAMAALDRLAAAFGMTPATRPVMPDSPKDGVLAWPD